MSRAPDRAVWHVPLLVLAGVAALLGLAVGVATWCHGLPDAAGGALQWALAGASVTFTLIRIAHQRRVGRRELELLLLGGAALLVEDVVVAAGVVIAVAILSVLGTIF